MRILITGGTSGIGRAVAMERAARGDKVHVVARDPAKLAALRPRKSTTRGTTAASW